MAPRQMDPERIQSARRIVDCGTHRGDDPSMFDLLSELLADRAWHRAQVEVTAEHVRESGLTWSQIDGWFAARAAAESDENGWSPWTRRRGDRDLLMWCHYMMGSYVLDRKTSPYLGIEYVHHMATLIGELARDHDLVPLDVLDEMAKVNP